VIKNNFFKINKAILISVSNQVSLRTGSRLSVCHTADRQRNTPALAPNKISTPHAKRSARVALPN
jgi:hypothetical protein